MNAQKSSVTFVASLLAVLPFGCASGGARSSQRDGKPASAELAAISGTTEGGPNVERATEPESVVAGSVPIVYYLRFDHPRLAPAQVERILTKAAPYCPAGRRPWFIYVTANWERKGRLFARAAVYFTPELQTPRLRKGTYVVIDEDWTEHVSDILRWPAFGEANRDAPRTAAPEYWQVSRREQPFGNELETPHGLLLPFASPDGFTDTEIVELVDFVRTSPRRPQEPNSVSCSTQFHGSRPIQSISIRDGAIEVENGALQGFLAGHGELLRCRRNDDGTFEVLGIGEWYS